MGGGKQARLFYGPRECKDQTEWLEIFGIAPKNGEYDSEYESEYESESDSESEKSESSIFYAFLHKHGLNDCYEYSFDWSTCRIGFFVKDYDQITKKQMKKVQDFCKEYKLSKPTFFAGMVGEFE